MRLPRVLFRIDISAGGISGGMKGIAFDLKYAGMKILRRHASSETGSPQYVFYAEAQEDLNPRSVRRFLESLPYIRSSRVRQVRRPPRTDG